MEIWVSGHSTNWPVEDIYLHTADIRLHGGRFPDCASSRFKMCPSAVWTFPENIAGRLEQLRRAYCLEIK